jgi:hypothetical protein
MHRRRTFVNTATTVLTLLSAALLGGPRLAAAQGPSPSAVAFLNVNVGAQPQQRDITTSGTFIVYDEIATVTSTQPVSNGPMFDVTGGYRVRERLAVAAGVSYFSTKGDSALVASIPDPIFTDRSRTVGATTPDLAHSEIGIHLQAVWLLPVTDRIDVALSAGPSVFRLSQELTPVVTVPARTQNINVAPENQDGMAVGFNAGFDGNFMFTPGIGVGLFARYAGASVDLHAVENLDVGGFQTGLGLRLKF